MAFKINLLRAATLPVRLCTSLVLLEDHMSNRAFIFSGLAYMPRWLTMNPKNFPEATPKVHLRGVEFHVVRSKDFEHIGQVGDVV